MPWKNFRAGVVLCMAAIVVSLCLIEAALRVALLDKRIQFYLVDQPGKKIGMYTYDKVLGWRNRPNFSGTLNWPYRRTEEKINPQGWRDQSYAYVKPEGVFRIAVIGCSRTYGYGVNADETYSKVLEGLLNTDTSKKFEVMNMGVNGYGLTQMALNYMEYVRPYSPDLVVLQFYNPTVYRASQTSMWQTLQPAFVLAGDKLRLLNSPVPEHRFNVIEQQLIKHSVLYRFIKEKLIKIEEINKEKFKAGIPSDKELHKLCARILAQLNHQVSQDNSQLVVFTWRNQGRWMQDILDQAGVRYLLLDDYSDITFWEKQGAIDNPPPTGHWSPVGHQFVAEALYRYIKETGYDR